MRKKVRNSGIIAVLLLGAIIITQCKKESDSATYGTLSGSVSLSDGTIADGAIVSLSTLANGADVISRVVADENGIYSIIGLKAGTYYLNATWEPSNNNNLQKSANTVILSGAESEINLSGDMTSNIELSGMVSSGGTGVVDLSDGWVWDNTHSMISFEFPYDAANAVFTGNFARVDFDEFSFDEANPESTVIKAWVDVTSVETGSPSPPCGHGRDGLTGCIANTYRVEKDPADTIDNYCSDGSVVTNWPNDELVAKDDIWGGSPASNYTKQSAIVGNSGVATFSSTGVMPYGTGYVATGDFTFAGFTTSVDLYFSYLEGYTNDDNTKTYASFYGWFKFDALGDYEIVSGHVGDSEITVKLSVQFNKSLE